MGTQIDYFKLIKLVKENPALYDPRHMHYTHAVVKQMLWDKIAKEFNKSSGSNVKGSWKYKPSYITSHWGSLKYTYIRRMQRKATGKTMKMWRYERDLEFLLPFLKDKISNGDDCTSDDSTEFEYTSGSDSIDDFDNDDVDEDDDDEDLSNGGVKDVRKKIDEKKLIELIKKNPVLYDVSGSRYKSVITSAWKGIADEFGMPVRSVKQCWRRLRKRYAKVLMYYRAHKDDDIETKRPRWKYHYEMEFIKSIIEAKLEKRDELVKKQTFDFFMSMAEKVKTFPSAEQEAMEILILDMITEAELEYHTELQKKKSTVTKLNNNSNQPNEGTSNGINSDIAVDEDEFISRVKWADNENNKRVTTSSAIPIIDDTKNVQPTERYVVKVIPEAASTELQEEFVINVLPDGTAAEINDKSKEIAGTKIKEEEEAQEMNDIKVEKDVVVKEETMIETVVKMEPDEVNS